MTNGPKFPRGTRVQTTLKGEVSEVRQNPDGEWEYIVRLDVVSFASTRMTCRETALEEDTE